MRYTVLANPTFDGTIPSAYPGVKELPVAFNWRIDQKAIDEAVVQNQSARKVLLGDSGIDDLTPAVQAELQKMDTAFTVFLVRKIVRSWDWTFEFQNDDGTTTTKKFDISSDADVAEVLDRGILDLLSMRRAHEAQQGAAAEGNSEALPVTS